jgi:hypothetical protein
MGESLSACCPDGPASPAPDARSLQRPASPIMSIGPTSSANSPSTTDTNKLKSCLSVTLHRSLKQNIIRAFARSSPRALRADVLTRPHNDQLRYRSADVGWMLSSLSTRLDSSGNRVVNSSM